LITVVHAVEQGIRFELKLFLFLFDRWHHKKGTDDLAPKTFSFCLVNEDVLLI
jgi:hypothetical protein